MTEQSLFIIKPDAVARNLTGEVIARFERKGFKLVKLKLFNFAKEQAENFYGVHKDKPFFGELVSFITSGPVVVAIIEGNNAIATTRIMIGATKSFEAAPGSIRGDFGLGFTDNIIHASDSQESFDHESRVAFE
ncbi:MAG: nucleoside-diphosphate kinase [Nitrososphaeria archaeon]|nr:nucleoside-diphosphate kinase [Nitrosopumilaceae archaeon]NIP09261.1 nucleoside-diphosphate kinase [Nitrosopumilaceae archaeon]NIP91135.1 nucleoside-diphosphate kinase [Nitrososphaeria archaeon]NIS94429.1 nucleoside-diphosphate kinase [Nitrosopumilaceae archaeon]